MALRLTPRTLKWALRLWPPYLGAGIRVRQAAPDLREVVVEMPLRWHNRNYFGTHFGGSLYAMCDPFFALMVVHNLGSDYLVWDKTASIEFVAPGRSTVSATFRVSCDDLECIRAATALGDKHLQVFRTNVVDREGLVVARVEKVVYVRRKRQT